MKFHLAILALLVAAAALAEEPKATAPAREPLTPRNDIPGLKNYAKVSDALHRGQQPTAEGFAELKKMGVKTVVNLRSFNSDRDELEGLGLQYVHIYCKAWHPEDEDVVKFLQVVSDPKNQPVFVHCQHGADRTGMMVASYRIVEQGWSVEDAAKELDRFGFHTLWTDIAKYLKDFNKTRLTKLMGDAKPAKIEVVK
jgi:protein tyrosine/serine phosphatase